MKILAADTSSTTGSVALLEDGLLAAEWTLATSRTHNRRLLKTVDGLLREAGRSLREMDGLAVTSGPGSFTGLRIGLSTFKTLAWALGKPFAGIPTMDALAAPLSFARHPLCALVDARKKEVYCAFYDFDEKGNPRLRGPCRALPPEELESLVAEPTLFCGDGWLAYRDLLRERLKERLVELPGPFHSIRAAFVASLARERLARGEGDDPVTAVPLYVRPSEAEINHPELAARFRK